MANYIVVATGPHLSQPLEKIVSTALEAVAQRDTLQRLAGKHGHVDVLRDGRLISFVTLNRLARDEQKH